MRTLTYTNLRTNLKSNLDYVSKNREPQIIKRPSGSDVVMISFEDYSGLVETAYLLSTESNLNHLNESIKQLKIGKTISLSL